MIRYKPHRLIFGLVLVWAIGLSAYAMARHQRLNSSGYDLAIESQVVWNTYQGRWFASSIEVNQYLGDHFAPIILLIAPVFALWHDVRILLILQAVALSLGAIPLYGLAYRLWQDEPWAFGAATVYLLYPAIGFINRFDFHPLAFVIPLFLWAFLWLETEKFTFVHVALLLALLCREEVGLTIAVLGLYWVWRGWRQGLIWTAVGLTWSLLAFFVFIPHFRGQASDTFSRYTWLGADSRAILTTLLTRPLFVAEQVLGDPLKRQFLAQLLLPVAFLSLLVPELLLIGLPALGYNLLSAIPSQSSIYFQYIAPLIPFVLLSAVYGADKMRRWLGPAKRWLLVGATAVALVVAWWRNNPFTYPIDDPYFAVYGLERHIGGEAFWQAQNLVPDDASVATMMAFAPHFALRPHLTLFADRSRLEQWPFGFPQADYLVVHLTDLRWGVNSRLFYNSLETAVGQLGYEAIYFADDVAVLRRGLPPQETTGAFLQRVIELEEAGGKFVPTSPQTLAWLSQQWATSTLPAEATSWPVPFEQGLHLLGYRYHPGSATCLTLYWQTSQPLPVDYTVFVHLVDPTGYVHSQRDGPTVLGYWPSSAWPSQTVIGDLHCLTLPPWLPPGTYQLSIGVYDAQSGTRLSLADGSADALLLPPLITK